MDAISATALSELEQIVDALLSSLPNSITITVIPQIVRTSGIGGYVAEHDDPQDDIVGRYVEARVIVQASNTNNQSLSNLSEASTIMLTLSREDMVQRGLYIIKPEPHDDLQRRVFHITYEYLHIPTEVGGIIETIPINSSLDDGTPI